jgi:hypothetical protein
MLNPEFQHFIGLWSACNQACYKSKHDVVAPFAHEDCLKSKRDEFHDDDSMFALAVNAREPNKN